MRTIQEALNLLRIQLSAGSENSFRGSLRPFRGLIYSGFADILRSIISIAYGCNVAAVDVQPAVDFRHLAFDLWGLCFAARLTALTPGRNAYPLLRKKDREMLSDWIITIERTALMCLRGDNAAEVARPFMQYLADKRHRYELSPEDYEVVEIMLIHGNDENQHAALDAFLKAVKLPVPYSKEMFEKLDADRKVSSTLIDNVMREVRSKRV